jgi:hypothetical protein
MIERPPSNDFVDVTRITAAGADAACVDSASTLVMLPAIHTCILEFYSKKSAAREGRNSSQTDTQAGILSSICDIMEKLGSTWARWKQLQQCHDWTWNSLDTTRAMREDIDRK